MTSRLSRTGLAFVLASVLLSASCASKPTTLLELKNGSPPPVQLTKCSADPEYVTVHYERGDMVTLNSQDQEYTVTFKSTVSPFANASISVPANGSASSGAVSLGAKACVLANTLVTLSSGSCYYGYTVKGNDGCTNDPGVIIQK